VLTLNENKGVRTIDKYSLIGNQIKGNEMDNSSAKPFAKVMIVDDELFFREMLRDVVVNAGYKVVAEAMDGNEAVGKYRLHRPDITIMDIFMPEMNGIDAIKEIIAFDADARVLIYTGMGFDEDVEVALKSGARELVLKNFLPEEVIEVINRVLSGQ
jgi:two-component system, chemotaxis family, chemotaxis protein CheY